MTVERRVRVLVAFDGSPPSEKALRQLPALLGADLLEVTGLYVEDEDLLRAARLPGMREISLAGHPVSLNVERVAADLAREAAAARRAFEHLALRLAEEHQQLEHRFQVARGRLPEELSRTAGESDFVVVARALRGAGLRPRQGRAFDELIRQPRHVLFVNEPWTSGSAVVVLGDSDLALGYGRRLAAAEDIRLVIAVPPGESPPAQTAGATVSWLTDLEETTIADLCFHADARLLVMAPRDDLNWPELLASLMDRLPCSLLKIG